MKKITGIRFKDEKQLNVTAVSKTENQTGRSFMLKQSTVNTHCL